MGNHVVGQMFDAGVSMLSESDIDNLTQEKALEIIDKIGAKVVATTSLDAEFDDYDNPNQPLGRVLIKAFFPERYEEWKNLEYVPDDENLDNEWWDKVHEPFTSRFGFW